MYSPLYNVPLICAHKGVGSLFDYVFQKDDYSYPNRISFIESRILGFLGLDNSINSYDLDRQMEHCPSVLFKTFPFFEKKYLVRNFERSEKICVYYPDGNTEEDGYLEELDNGLKYPMVFYSPPEYRAWMCISALAKLNFYPNYEAEMIKMIERNFNVDDCLVLMHKKLTGAEPWSFGLEGVFSVNQKEWSQQASSPEKNIPYIKWLAMAEAVWARQFVWSTHSSMERRL